MSQAESGPKNTRPRRVSARRLLAATIGAATLNYATGCEDVYGMAIANLMAPPMMPPGPNAPDAALPDLDNPNGPMFPPPQDGLEDGDGGADDPGGAST